MLRTQQALGVCRANHVFVQQPPFSFNSWIKPVQYTSSPSLRSAVFSQVRLLFLTWGHGIRPPSVNVILESNANSVAALRDGMPSAQPSPWC